MTSNLKVVAKKAMASMTMVASVLSLGGYAVIPTAALAAVPADYGLTEGDTIRATGDVDIFIVNAHGYKRLFVNPAIFNLYGHLGWSKVKEVSPSARDAFPTSGLFRNCESGDQKVYGLEVVSGDVANLRWVNTSGAQAVADDPNFFSKVFCINNAEMALYGTGTPYTSVSQVPQYGGSPSPTPGSGGLNGGAGSLENADFISSLNNEEVGEGQNNIKVAGLDLEADNGSDLRVTSVKLEFVHASGPGSTDLEDYADSVSLWFGSTKVGEVDVDDFNEDAGTYDKSISLSGDAVIRMDQAGQLYVAVSALDVIDSGDQGDGWNVKFANVRYVDAQGAVTTDDTTDDIGANRTFTFESYGSAADLELELTEASDNPEAQVVEISSTSATDGVVLLSTELEAQGGDITINEMTVTIATSGATLESIASSLVLEVDGDEVQTLDTNECSNATVSSCVFDDVDFDLGEGDQVKVRVLADVEAKEDIGVEGATLLASIDNADTDADDQNGDALASGDKTGDITGEAQAFFSQGIKLAFVSASESKDVADNASDTGNFEIKFTVTAFGDDMYVPADCQVGTGSVSYAVTGTIGSTNTCTITSTGDTSSAPYNNFEVLEGDTETLTMTIAVEGADTFVKIDLDEVNYRYTDDAAATLLYNFNLDDFETDSIYLSST